MRENRRFVRVRPAGLVSRAAKIIADPRTPVVDCNIIDLSAGGACLEVPGTGTIPKRFVLFHGGTKKSVTVVWQKGRRIGVRY